MTEDNSCGVQDGLAPECPVNEEARKANINGAQRWEDQDDKAMIREGERNVGVFFGLIEELGLITGPRSGVAFTNSRLFYMRLLLFTRVPICSTFI